MSVNRFGSLGIGLLVGTAVGSTIMLLFAPKSGRATRSLIKSTVSGARHSFGEKISGEECSK